MGIFNSITLVLVVIGIVIYALIHGFGFRLAGEGLKLTYLRRIAIQAIMVPVVMVAWQLFQFLPIEVLRVFEPIYRALPINNMPSGMSVDQAVKISRIIMGGVGLAILILLLAILLTGVTRLVARGIGLPRAFLAALWAYVIFPGIPAMIGLAIAFFRIPN